MNLKKSYLKYLIALTFLCWNLPTTSAETNYSIEIKSDTTDPKKAERKTITAQPKAKTHINQNAMFGGRKDVDGVDWGDGGATQGIRGSGYTGNGFTGRRLIEKCDRTIGFIKNKKIAVISICIDDKGKVIEAVLVKERSTVTDQTQIKTALECAKEYKYSRAPGIKKTCGEITLAFEG